MYLPKFELNRYTPLEGLLTFTLNGNNNLVVRRNSDDVKNKNFIKMDISHIKTCRFAEYLIDSGAGTNKGIGRAGDITTTGTSRLTYVMITRDKDKPIPPNKEVYNGSKLIKPNEFIVYTLGNDKLKIDATFEICRSTNEPYLSLKMWNVPREGVTLPTTITDGFTNWLSYWFSTEATARRIKDVRGKITKFKGHHSMSDIYITEDIVTHDKLLVAIFNDKHPAKCLVFREHMEHGKLYVQLYTHDILTNETVFIESFRKTIASHEIIDYINGNLELKDYKIKAKGDVETFCTYYSKWLYSLTKRCGGGTFYV